MLADVPTQRCQAGFIHDHTASGNDSTEVITHPLDSEFKSTLQLITKARDKSTTTRKTTRLLRLHAFLANSFASTSHKLGSKNDRSHFQLFRNVLLYPSPNPEQICLNQGRWMSMRASNRNLANSVSRMTHAASGASAEI